MDRITDLASEAYCGSSQDEATESLAVILAPVRVQQLAEEYVSVKYHKCALDQMGAEIEETTREN